jgi:hypothetical protein
MHRQVLRGSGIDIDDQPPAHFSGEELGRFHQCFSQRDFLGNPSQLIRVQIGCKLLPCSETLRFRCRSVSRRAK